MGLKNFFNKLFTQLSMVVVGFSRIQTVTTMGECYFKI